MNEKLFIQATLSETYRYEYVVEAYKVMRWWSDLLPHIDKAGHDKRTLDSIMESSRSPTRAFAVLNSEFKHMNSMWLWGGIVAAMGTEAVFAGLLFGSDIEQHKETEYHKKQALLLLREYYSILLNSGMPPKIADRYLEVAGVIWLLAMLVGDWEMLNSVKV